jgi:DNA-binding LacI/PurR family transcriptional regulator
MFNQAVGRNLTKSIALVGKEMMHAVNSLLQLGHREIALIQSPVTNQIMGQRQSGYEKACNRMC